MKSLVLSAAGLGLVIAGLSGCQQNASRSDASLDQAKLCQVDTWKPVTVANSCEPGQKVVFRPSKSAADDAPVLFAAANCDMRYAVAVTPVGATCIYKPIRSAGKLGAPAADNGSSS
ncbi:hypothetical protein [Salinisphaera hydrothermalis]|uniref:Lipoprotein n=1 Tax=Salinisphaera hydrothermalis (strain C41B8) TaxID=1304275 RepID=A0A084IHD6_SALHC|nr:hypothetical protein [Salinisphaera hydrothermalis]KEZ76120.1 hypothetical protein C41B8_16639 [Salinisphaera hydrothermalis C41B8]